ncbi:MAG: hypothetical protein JST93_05275 [Acidobacteria bacterium]|nr:hypothetical protein [Acidobacteriota bacterium]
MPAISIPDDHKLGLEQIRDLPLDTVSQLIAALRECPKASDAGSTVKLLIDRVPSFSPPDAQRIINTLDSLYELKGHFEVSSETLAGDLIAAALRSNRHWLPQAEVPTFKERLIELLSIGSLAVRAKARVLERDHNQLFHDGRILTDLRPVFGLDPSEEPVGVVISHTLKVVFHEGLGEHKELYLVLDLNDLAHLREVVDRAEKKHSVLRSMLESKGIKIL